MDKTPTLAELIDTLRRDVDALRDDNTALRAQNAALLPENAALKQLISDRFCCKDLGVLATLDDGASENVTPPCGSTCAASPESSKVAKNQI